MAHSYITLDSVINDYLNDSDSSIHKYSKCYHIAYRGMEELGLDFFYNIKTVKLPVLSNKTVPLPLDCIKYTKIGVLNGQGEIVPLNFNNNLTNFGDMLPNRQEVSEDNTIFPTLYSPTSPVFFNYWYNGAFTNIFGLPSGGAYVGSFKVDDANGIILFNEDYAFDYIMIEYLASPSESIEYVIPLHFRAALLAYLWWKEKKSINVKRGAVGIQRELSHEYYNERRLANARWKPFYLNEAYQITAEAQRLTIKV